MRSRVTFCTIFASVPVGFKPTGTEPNRNFNGLVLELSIRFGLVSKVKTESIGSVRNRIIARRTYDEFKNMKFDVILIFSITSSFTIKKIFVQRIQIFIISIFAITKYKAQKSIFNTTIFDLKIKSKKQSENNHHKFCSTYVQLSRLRIFFEFHILEFFIMNDFKHELNLELMIEMKRLQILQKKIIKN